MKPPVGTCRLRYRLWPAMVILLLVLQLFWPFKMWAALLGIMGGGWLIAFLWARSLARNLAARRKMRYGWTQVGDRLEERFVLSNAGWAPAIWLELQDHSDLPGYNASCVTAIDAEGFTEWHTQGICTRRGLFTIGPASLTCTEPLGLYNVTLPIPDSAALLVLPPILALPTIEVASGGRAGEGRRHRHFAFETTVSVQTVRSYVEGDPLRAIHWPTSARKDQLFVRQFEQTPSSDWWICLDLYRRAQVGEGERSTAEYGVTLAASLAYRGLQLGHSVGLATCGQDMVWIPPQRNPGHLESILRALAMVNPGEQPLEVLLNQVCLYLHSGASLILITPDLRPKWIVTLSRLARVGITPTVLLLDPLSFGGEQSARGMADWFAQHGIAHTIVTPDLLDHPEAVNTSVQSDEKYRVVRNDSVYQPIQVNWKKTR